MITFHQKVTNYPQLVNKYTEIILILQNMLIYVLFIDCRESHLCAFCRQIHQCARIGGREGGVKPILAMPGYWKRLSLHALPKSLKNGHLNNVKQNALLEKEGFPKGVRKISIAL